MFLIFHYKEVIIEHPPVPVLQRKTVETNTNTTRYSIQNHIDSISFTLQHSGKVIRKVDSSPPLAFRSWVPLEQSTCDNKQTLEQALIDKQIIAETLYIVKPVIHLASAAYFGNNTWKPWVISFLFDLYR